jgi:hypothetical protein
MSNIRNMIANVSIIFHSVVVIVVVVVTCQSARKLALR